MQLSFDSLFRERSLREERTNLLQRNWQRLFSRINIGAWFIRRNETSNNNVEQPEALLNSSPHGMKYTLKYTQCCNTRETGISSAATRIVRLLTRNLRLISNCAVCFLFQPLECILSQLIVAQRNANCKYSPTRFKFSSRIVNY